MAERVLDKQTEIGKKRVKKKWVIIISGMLAVLLFLLALYGNEYTKKPVEQIEGTIELPMLKKEVEIITDGQGVPQINAKNDHDLYMAQGYVQAQYRLFQMEMSRRQASGTLSEVVGEAAVDQDKYFRTVGLRRAAAQSYDVYSEEAKEILHAFAEGINAYINQAKEDSSLPIEFTIMGFEPKEWTALDSLTIGKYMAFDLGGHWERQAFHYFLLQNYNEKKAYDLFPSYPSHKPVIMEEEFVSVHDRLKKAIIPHELNGSNNWVISGEKTQTGLPLLANDPHLGLATPSIWIQMKLKTNQQQVSGVIFAGVPGIILGHNDKIAWGVTNTGPDVQQLYLEKRNPDQPTEYLYEEKWEQAKVIKEPIAVKDGKTIDYQVVETRHGPVISEFAEDSGKDNVLSLRWTALEPTTELEAILQMNKAENWQEFEKGLEKFLVPAQNFVFASVDGTIAFKANGNIPIYRDGKEALLPLPGWDKDFEWKGYIPFDKLPTIVNPEKDYIATANNKVTMDDYPYHISNVWAQPYRYERIVEVLEANERLTIQDMKKLQMDSFNRQAKEFVPLFITELEGIDLSGQAKQAIELLRKWDYKDLSTAAQPLIFHHWYETLENIIYQDIPDSMMNLFTSKGQTTDELLRTAIKEETSQWINDQGGLQNILSESLNQALSNLEKEYGKNSEKWQWGDYHQVEFKHPLSSIHPVLAFLFNRKGPIPSNGSSVTPMAADYDSETGIINHGAPWRFVIDMSQADQGYHLVAPGQSGHIKSKWYDDQLEDWVTGNYHITKLNETVGKPLILQPKKDN
ncbi:penicillin acylase family protein [Cerasibacillus sp. JNUCC 74]